MRKHEIDIYYLISQLSGEIQSEIDSGSDILPFNADYFEQSNQDANGNYQTIVFKKGGSSGTTVKTINLNFDTDGNIINLEVV